MQLQLGRYIPALQITVSSDELPRLFYFPSVSLNNRVSNVTAAAIHLTTVVRKIIKLRQNSLNNLATEMLDSVVVVR